MLKNLKHTILFIFIVIILLSVIFIFLAASKPVNQIEVKGISVSEDASMNTAAISSKKGQGLKDQQWSGLGMSMFSAWDTEVMDDYVDTLLANGFTELRIDIPDYQDTDWLAASKVAVVRAVEKGAKVVWGVSSNKYNNPDYEITAKSWPAFRQAILDAAQWAQDNGVYEFQLGNEEEYHIDDTTMTHDQMIVNLKSLATEVQEIFTNGKISYSCGQIMISEWATAGKGDIDILAANVYQMHGSGNYDWQNDITNLITTFGPDGVYLTEFNLSSISLNSYSTDEEIQAEALSEMIEYIKASGIKRAFFFCWQTNEFGVLKSDGTYRLLWG